MFVRATMPTPSAAGFDCGQKRNQTPRRVRSDALERIQKGSTVAARSGTTRKQSSGKRAVWRDLQDHYTTMQGLHLRNLFADDPGRGDRKSTRLNSSHVRISYAVFCLKKKKQK